MEDSRAKTFAFEVTCDSLTDNFSLAARQLMCLTSMMISCGKTYFFLHIMDASSAINTNHFLSNLARVRSEVSRSKEPYIKEHLQKYDDPDLPPVWKTLEVVSLGTLSKLFSNFSDNKAKNIVAGDFRLSQFLVLDSWLESLTALRNYIAHHARIWNRRFPQKPELLRRSRYPWITTNPRQPFKLYSILCCIAYWLNAIDEKNTFVSDFKNLLKKYPSVNPELMGFSTSWSQEPLWNI